MPALTRTQRLLLRAPCAQDVQAVFEIYGDAATNIYTPWLCYENLSVAKTNLDRWIGHWETHGFGQWAVALTTQPEKVIGFGGIAYRMYDDVEKLNLGYHFSPTVWGQGYATELGVAAIELATKKLNASEVCALIRANNEASIRIVKKLGMHQHGELAHEAGRATRLVFSTLSIESNTMAN
jgi:[ribosomal protein S5]-alanine N-acetyltransferase